MSEIFEKICKAVDIELESLRHFRENLGNEAADAVKIARMLRNK